MTNSDFDRDSPVMMSSTMPSAKYSCSGSPLMFWNGSTAMEGLSGRASGCAVSVGGFVTIAGEELGPMRTRQTRIGSAIFFKDCEPISSKVISTLPRICR